MEVMGFDSVLRVDILRVVAAILHMGNIMFHETDNRAVIEDDQCGWQGAFDVYFTLRNYGSVNGNSC